MEGAQSGPGDFSREELDRIIRRAAELQFGETEGRGVGTRVDQGEVLRIGREVGIESHHLRRAIGEVRAEALGPGLPDDRGLLARTLGPGLVQVGRVVAGSVDDLGPSLEEHFLAGEGLSRIRKRDGRSLWEPAGGLMASLQRELRWKGFRYDLARAGSVELTLSDMEEGYVLVTITADLRTLRGERGAGWMLGAGTGVGLGGWAVGLGFGIPWLGIPSAVLGVWVGTRMARTRFEREVRRVRLAMEGILDRVESGEPLASRKSGDWRDRVLP